MTFEELMVHTTGTHSGELKNLIPNLYNKYYEKITKPVFTGNLPFYAIMGCRSIEELVEKYGPLNSGDIYNKTRNNEQ